MARKSNSQQVAEQAKTNPVPPFHCASDAEWGGYLNINLNDEQAQAFNDMWRETYEEWQIELQDQVSKGRKYSVGWDASGGCFIASLTGRITVTSPQRFCLTSRSPNFFEATALLMFKHVELLSKDWGTFTFKNKFKSDWG